MLRSLLLTALLAQGACPIPSVVEAEFSEAATIPEVWAGLGGTLTLEAVVSSPRTADKRGFFLADPAGGAHSGLYVRLGGVFDDLPPPVGTPIQIVGPTIEAVSGPGVLLRNVDDLTILGEPAPLPPSAWSDDPGLDQALVILADVQITSGLDPAGLASTDGPAGVGGLFGIGPGFRRSGDLIGILSGGRISLRTADDWGGPLEGDPPWPSSLEELDTLADGALIHLDDLLQATPWDRAGRWSVLQDAEGRGLWVDAESWGLWRHSDPGTLASWEGELRHDPQGPYLRAWLPPLPTGGTRPPQIVASDADGVLLDGSLIATTVSGLGAPGPLGERSTVEGPLLDDRFVDLGPLLDPAEIIAAVRGSDPPSLAVLP